MLGRKTCPAALARRDAAGSAAQCHETVVGRRMGRQGARLAAVLGLPVEPILESRLAPQLLDQRDHRVAAIAGARDVSDADPIGLELLVARISAQLDQPVACHRAADRPNIAAANDRSPSTNRW